MAIDRCFEAALQKGSPLPGDRGSAPSCGRTLPGDREKDLLDKPSHFQPSDIRLWTMMYALRRGVTPETLCQAAP